VASIGTGERTRVVVRLISGVVVGVVNLLWFVRISIVQQIAGASRRDCLWALHVISWYIRVTSSDIYPQQECEA